MFMRLNIQNPVNQHFSKKDVSPKIGSHYWNEKELTFSKRKQIFNPFHSVGSNIASINHVDKTKKSKRERQQKFADDLRSQIEFKLRLKHDELQKERIWHKRKNKEIYQFSPKQNNNIFTTKHNKIVNSYYDYKRNNEKQNFLGALHEMTNPKTTREIQNEIKKKQQFKQILSQQIEENKKRKQLKLQKEREIEMKEQYEYNEYNEYLASPKVLIKNKNQNIMHSPPSFIPRKIPITNDYKPQKLYLNNIDTKYNGNMEDNIKNFNENEYFFNDLLNKEWNVDDTHLKKMHHHSKQTMEADLLRKSIHPSNSVFVFDDVTNKNEDENDELERLLRSFVDNG